MLFLSLCLSFHWVPLQNPQSLIETLLYSVRLSKCFVFQCFGMFLGCKICLKRCIKYMYQNNMHVAVVTLVIVSFACYTFIRMGAKFAYIYEKSKKEALSLKCIFSVENLFCSHICYALGTINKSEIFLWN